MEKRVINDSGFCKTPKWQIENWAQRYTIFIE